MWEKIKIKQGDVYYSTLGCWKIVNILNMNSMLQEMNF